MLYFLWHNAGERKMLLLALEGLSARDTCDPSVDAVVKVIEDFAEGRVGTDELAVAKREAERLQRDLVEGRFDGCSRHLLRNLIELADRSLVDTLQMAATPECIREIFGNPFRHVAFDPKWRTSAVVSLARQMYESRDFSAMPILADALQEANCDNDDILSHCRGRGTHVRGCWVVDLVLDKK
jgi:hypothetical protein